MTRTPVGAPDPLDFEPDGGTAYLRAPTHSPTNAAPPPPVSRRRAEPDLGPVGTPITAAAAAGLGLVVVGMTPVPDYVPLLAALAAVSAYLLRTRLTGRRSWGTGLRATCWINAGIWTTATAAFGLSAALLWLLVAVTAIATAVAPATAASD